MNPRTAFVRAIAAAPNDDTPRLIFADWLEEQGELDRAEFIRVQIALETIPADDSRRSELQRRERALLRKHQKTWRAECPAWVRLPVSGFKRGFLPLFDATVGDWLKKGVKVAESVPVLRLILRGTAKQLPALAKSEAVRHVGILELSHWHLEGAAIAPLVESESVAGLYGLVLWRSGVDAVGVRAVAGSPHLANLRRLTLEENRIGAAGVNVLAKSPHLTQLVSLNLRACHDIGPVAGAALAASPLLRSLEEFRLGYCDLGPEGARAIFAAPMPKLHTLDICGNAIGDTGAAALASARHLKQLTWLDLSYNGITAAGVRQLARARHLSRLTYLGLGGADGDAVTELSRSAVFGNLTGLNLYGGAVGDVGAAALAVSLHLTRLTNLELSDAQIGTEGALALARCSNLDGIEVLSLWRNPFDNQGRRALRDRFKRLVGM